MGGRAPQHVRDLVRWLAYLGSAYWLAACQGLSLPGMAAVPVRAGDSGVLPAVIDLRRSGGCSGIPAWFTVRFSQPMERSSVEALIQITEVLGDYDGESLPLGEKPLRPDPSTVRWEDGGRKFVFQADLVDGRQYIIVLPETVVSETGKPLDGRVGGDVDGDGVTDIQMDPDQYARIDDDFVRVPAPFWSLPFFLCSDLEAPSNWRVPLNDARPRVVALAGLLPNNEQIPRYIEAPLLPGGSEFSVQEGAYHAIEPLPPLGVLRLTIATNNTAPTRTFVQRWGGAPVRPSTLVGNFDVLDEGGRSAGVRLHLDDRLLVAAPLVGEIKSATGNSFSSDVLPSHPAAENALMGMIAAVRRPNGYLYLFPIRGNQVATKTVTVDPVFFADDHVTANQGALVFPTASFRENELKGLKAYSENPFDPVLTIEGNRAKQVRVQGIVQCARASAEGCRYEIRTDLAALGLIGAQFEIISPSLYISTPPRATGQLYSLAINFGEESVRDIFGWRFSDAHYDGNEASGKAADEWRGQFPSGDIRGAGVPPTLQLNDGRWYAPAPNLNPGTKVRFGSEGDYVYLGHGLFGREILVCSSGSLVKRIQSLGMIFATPDGVENRMGPDDLLDTDTINLANFAVFREVAGPVALPVAVTATTVQLNFYVAGVFVARTPTTFVRLDPPLASGLETSPGPDTVCGTKDDSFVAAVRPWQTGDRLFISHRVSHSRGDRNTLDGNYDGIVSLGNIDDMLFEYRPQSEGGAFIPIPQ